MGGKDSGRIISYVPHACTQTLMTAGVARAMTAAGRISRTSLCASRTVTTPSCLTGALAIRAAVLGWPWRRGHSALGRVGVEVAVYDKVDSNQG